MKFRLILKDSGDYLACKSSGFASNKYYGSIIE